MPKPIDGFSLPSLRGLAVALALGGGLPGDATATNTLQINGETKQVEGILREAVSGDVACYLQLEDESGTPFQETAAFELCEDPALIGKRLRLSYTVENVLAAECEGNVDCGKSDRVVLVSSARVITRAAAQTETQTLCAPDENVVFACRTGQKQVSVCASGDASKVSGYLQYRFGPANASAPVELVLPTDRPVPRLAARGESVPFSGGGGSWLRFHNGRHAYVVYSGIGRWGRDGETMELQGVQVERDGRPIATLACSGPLQSELGPDWFDQVGIISEGEDFHFPVSE